MQTTNTEKKKISQWIVYVYIIHSTDYIDLQFEEGCAQL